MKSVAKDDSVKLPNADKAVVDMAKLTAYALNSQHPTGRHKARVFRAVLGLTATDGLQLREKLLEVVRTHSATEAEPSDYGRRFAIDFEMATDTGQATVRSAWIIRHTEDFPRLTSCYVMLDQ